ncbi:MAG: Hsp70 family protein [Steroidobacteraceae bacterium]
MRVGIGLDFGTSNSAAAWFDGERLHSIVLEEGAAGPSPILPTAVHLDREYRAQVGSRAIAQYVEENRGRRVELVATVIGESASSVGGNEAGEDISRLHTERHVVYGPPVDRTLPGRLFLGLKRLLGDPEIERLSVFDRQYRLVALLTPILQHMREGIGRVCAAPLLPIHVGRPVHFEGRHPGRDAVAASRLAEALGHAGLPLAQFGSEPVAATLSWGWRVRPPRGALALTVDFGGGTLDLSLIRHDDTRFEVLATKGLALGGDRIDQLIFESMLFPQLGQGESWVRPVDGREVNTLFPFGEFEAGLVNWPTTFLLNQNRTRFMVADRLARGGPGGEKFQRLLDLISYNYSYNCFAAIKRAKAALSTVEATVIDIPELNLRLPFTRRQLDVILQPVLASLRAAIGEVLDAAGRRADEVDVAIRTGGTSEIVAVRNLLEELFPGRVVGHEPFTSVASGLAIANFRGQALA